jgi:hypothetical protein
MGEAEGAAPIRIEAAKTLAGAPLLPGRAIALAGIWAG